MRTLKIAAATLALTFAAASTAQAARETEASSAQTLQTASQLAGMSRELLRLVRPQAA